MATVKLGELLVGRGLITPHQLEEALAAQQQLGGRLGTNLVELGIIDDAGLAACLSEQLGVPYAPPQALAGVPKDVIALLPRNLAKKYRAVPLRVQGTELHLCVADPHNFEQLDELAFALNRRLRPYVVTEVTLNYALERYYNVPREPRLAPQVTAWREVDRGRTLPTLPLPPAREAGTVIDQLAAVMSDDDVVRALFRYFTELFAEVVLLALADGHVVPVRAGTRVRSKPGQPAVAVSFAPGTLLRALAEKPQVLHHPRLADAELKQICTSLGMLTGNVTLISLFSGNRPFYVVAGQGLDEAQLVKAFADLRAFVAKAAHALRIVALRKEIRAA